MNSSPLLTWTPVWLSLLLATSSFAESSTYGFLRTETGARPAAFGGAFVSIADDPGGMFYNPALAATLESPAGSVGFFKHLLDINAGHLAYSRPFEELGGTFSLGILYMNYGSFDERDEFGTVLGTFNAADLAVLLGYSTMLEDDLAVGVHAKFIHSSIAGYTSSAIAGDAGIFYRIPDSRIALGASVRNLGVQLSSFGETRESLPVDVSAGISLVPRGLPLLLSVNFHRLTDGSDNILDRFAPFSIGGEFTLSRVLQLRFGYENEKRRDLKLGTSAGLAGFSAGLGIHVSGYRIDYALSSLGKAGSLHRISIASSF